MVAKRVVKWLTESCCSCERTDVVLMVVIFTCTVLADILQQQFQKNKKIKTSNSNTCLKVETLHTTHVRLCGYPEILLASEINTALFLSFSCVKRT